MSEFLFYLNNALEKGKFSITNQIIRITTIITTIERKEKKILKLIFKITEKLWNSKSCGNLIKAQEFLTDLLSVFSINANNADISWEILKNTNVAKDWKKWFTLNIINKSMEFRVKCMYSTNPLPIFQQNCRDRWWGWHPRHHWFGHKSADQPQIQGLRSQPTVRVTPGYMWFRCAGSYNFSINWCSCVQSFGV